MVNMVRQKVAACLRFSVVFSEFALNVNVYTGWSKKTDTLCLYALISSNINRFSNLFHCLNQQNICNNTFTKDPTTPQVCRYTTL